MSKNSPPTERQVRVLVIDDQEEVRLVLQTALEAVGHAVILADSGAEGLNLANHQDPDVVLLDLLMVGMNGLQVLENLKGSLNTASIPVILLTAGREEEMLQRGLKLGAEGFLTKPCSIIELRTWVRQLADRKRDTGSLDPGPQGGYN